MGGGIVTENERKEGKQGKEDLFLNVEVRRQELEWISTQPQPHFMTLYKL